MKALFIGGTGTISAAIVRRLVEMGNWEIWLLNRGNRPEAVPSGVHQIICDISDEADAATKLRGMYFDCVCECIGFTVDQVARDWRLFRDMTDQYIFTSSASAYHKPAPNLFITEGTSLANPHWEYSRNKIACEEFLMEKYRAEGFPVTIVRPSHTYDERNLPIGVHGEKGSWQVVERMRQGKPVIIQGDGTSLWTVTYNTDFAVGYTALMGNRHAVGEAFQITGDEALTWNQIYLTIAQALGVRLNAVHVSSDFLSAAGAPMGYDFEGSLTGDKSECAVFDNAKLKRLAPDMRTTVPFHVGARIVLDNMLAHPRLQVRDEAFDAWCDRVIAARQRALEALLP